MPFASLGFGSVRNLLLSSTRKRQPTVDIDTDDNDEVVVANSNRHACTAIVTDTATTTVAELAVTEPDTPSSKRARRAQHADTATNSTASLHLQHGPPSLEISTTFESTSSSSSPPVSSSSSSSSQSTSRTLTTITNNHPINILSNRNEASNKLLTSNQQRKNHSSNEYYTAAISCARSRLHAAQRMSLHSEQHLLRAREENEQSKLEVHNAMALVDAVEKKWGVINIESDDEEEEEEKNDNADTNNRRSSKSAAFTDASYWYQHNGDDCSTDKDPEAANKVQLIHVSNAGESIVHGRYHLHHPTTSHNVVIEPQELNAISTQYSSPILPPQHYIHDDGPFLIQNSMYDVCIFPRGGYGDKVRWCIGLVPCQDCDCDQCCHHALCCDANDVNRNVTIYSDDNNKENNENGSVEQSPQLEQQRQQQQRRHHHDRSRNFALAYIYYWMEVDARTETDACLFSKVDVASGESELLVPSWRVCHGSRPLPVLEDVTGWRGTKRWWQVWK